jgi:hypothetical protein
VLLALGIEDGDDVAVGNAYCAAGNGFEPVSRNRLIQ